MKVIISYSSYFSYGKSYQAKFIYDNEAEIECINNLMEQLKSTKLFKPYYINESNNISFKKTNKIGGTNIKKEIIHPIISTFLSLKNTDVIIGNYSFNDYNTNKIEKALNTLHINATLYKGNYFNYDDTYYIIFKYANEEQKDEILYEFYNNLNNKYGFNEERNNQHTEQITPFLINRNGTIEFGNNSIIGGLNIPEYLLKDLLKKFIEKHDMIINIGNYSIKDNFKEETINRSLKTITKTYARKKIKI